MEEIKNLLDTAAELCGSADMARRVILVIGIAIIILCSKKYFKTHHKIHMVVMVAALLACTSAACYYKPEKLPLMVPVVFLAILLLYLVFTGKDTRPVRMPEKQVQGKYTQTPAEYVGTPVRTKRRRR